MSFDSWQAETVKETILFAFMHRACVRSQPSCIHTHSSCACACSSVHTNACRDPAYTYIGHAYACWHSETSFFVQFDFFFSLIFLSNMILTLLFLSFTGFTSLQSLRQLQLYLCIVSSLYKRHKGIGACSQLLAHHASASKEFCQRHPRASTHQEVVGYPPHLSYCQEGVDCDSL